MLPAASAPNILPVHWLHGHITRAWSLTQVPLNLLVHATCHSVWADDDELSSDEGPLGEPEEQGVLDDGEADADDTRGAAARYDEDDEEDEYEGDRAYKSDRYDEGYDEEEVGGGPRGMVIQPRVGSTG